MMISDLPVDLESEILSRVPATSLSQLRSTCKRWYTLFKDPTFVKKHLGKAAREVKVMVQLNLKVHSIRVNLHGIHNGVENKRLVVWNPCTGETRWIKARTCYKSNDCYALGFRKSKSSCHSYKILRFCRHYNDQNIRVGETYEIYEFSSDSWRVLDDVTHKWGIFCLGVTLKGNGYWVAGSKETGFVMLNFDFTTEEFGCLTLPFQSNNPEDTAVLSVVREEQLSVIHQDILAFSNVMRIWVTNKIDDETKEVSWSKFFEVDFDKFELSTVANVQSFLVDEDNKVAVCCDSFDNPENGKEDSTQIYIVGEDIHREVYKEITKGPSFNSQLMVSYVPSLVQI